MIMSDLAELVRDRPVLLLDFDGPICSVFAGYPAHIIAAELREVAASHGIQVPATLADIDDPLAFLRGSGDIARVQQIPGGADALRDREVIAVETATPTLGAADVLQAAQATGRHVVIVSNNSTEAVKAYLRHNDLHVKHVSARTDGMAPRLLKPDIFLVAKALRAIGMDASGALFVGDSPSDVTAGRSAGVAVVGFSNKPAKRAAMLSVGASVVVDNIAEFAEVMRQRE